MKNEAFCSFPNAPYATIGFKGYLEIGYNCVDIEEREYHGYNIDDCSISYTHQRN